MAFTPHTLVAFGGTLDTAQTQNPEIWQCGVRLGGGGVNDSPAYMASITTPLSNWFKGSTLIPSTCTLDWLKVNSIGADGKYTSPVTFVHDYSPKVAGTGVAAIPNILGSAITWTTAYSRGPGHEGRIFLPVYGIGEVSGAGMTIDPADITKLITLGKGLLSLLAAGTGATTTSPSVLSKINGADRSITGVKVGNVLDVQRRRKDALKETYTASVWP